MKSTKSGRAGDLDRYLTFEVLTEASPPQSDFGEPLYTWEAAFRTWGAFEGLGTREFPAAHKVHAETTARFIIRYKDNIDPATYRIVMGDQTWNILGVLEIDRGFNLSIEASLTA